MDHIGNRAVHDVDCYFNYYDCADGRYDAGVFVDDVDDCGFDVQLNYHDVVHYHHDDYGDTNDRNYDHETNDQLFTDVGQDAFKNAIGSMQHQGVSHFGILNAYGIHTTSTKFADCLNALK
ncbi:hypothetical protein V5799_026034, partial [Amblyomma americanum]